MVSQQYWGKGDHWHKGLCSERICERVQWLQANAFDFIQEQWKAQRIRKWYLFKLSIENLLIEKNTEDPFTFLNFSLRNEKSLGRRMWWLNFQFNEEYLGDVTGEYWRSQSVGKVFIKDPLSQGRQHLKYSHPTSEWWLQSRLHFQIQLPALVTEINGLLLCIWKQNWVLGWLHPGQDGV